MSEKFNLNNYLFNPKIMNNNYYLNNINNNKTIFNVNNDYIVNENLKEPEEDLKKFNFSFRKKNSMNKNGKKFNLLNFRFKRK